MLLQDMETESKDRLRKEEAKFNHAISKVQKDLAVRVALANGWEEDVRVLKHRVDTLECNNQSMLDVTMALKERSAVAEGKEMALQAEHRLRVGQLEEQLKSGTCDLYALQLAKALSESELRVRCIHPECFK
jgi:hypothetical protein